jgi:hypothetical protein
MDEQMIFDAVNAYFSINPEKLQIVSDTINGNAFWSCREMEKTIMFTDGLYNQYMDQRELYGRELFDPFRRSHRLTYKGIDTSLGQLNFFKWIFEEKIFNF